MLSERLEGAAVEALLVVDMQNSFCHAEGSFSRMGYDVSGCRAAVPACVALVEAARSCAIPIFFVTYAYEPDYSDGGYLVDQIHPKVVEYAAMARGTWDVDVVDELAPLPGERRIVKNRYSAFVGTDLADQLTALGVDAVTVCGVTTNVCVEGTARDAAQLDLRVTVVEDATGEMERSRHDSSLATVRHALGRVAVARTVTNEWSSADGPEKRGGVAS